MITKMKKLAVLIYHKEREKFATELQALGVVHLEENPDRNSQAAADIMAKVRAADRMLGTVSRLLNSAVPLVQQSVNAPTAIGEFEAFEQQLAQLDSTIVTLRKDEIVLAPWGEFDPKKVKRIVESGLSFRFLRAPRSVFESVDRSSHIVSEIGDDAKNVLFTVIGSQTSLPPEVEELRLPDESLSVIRGKLDALMQERSAVVKNLAGLSRFTSAVRAWRDEQESSSRWVLAQQDMTSHAEGSVLALRGYFPAKNSRKISALLDGYSAWYSISDPVPGDDVPTQMENGPFARLFEPITAMYMLPSYWELDPTPFFAPLFAFFVGLCLGDVAYGSIIVALSLFARSRVAPKVKPMISMITILGCMVIFAGILLNSCFGVALFGGPGIPEGTAFINVYIPFLSPPPLSPIETAQGTAFPAMSFSIVIAILQLTFALFLQMFNKYRTGGWLAVLSPVSMLLLFWGGMVCMAHTNFMDLNMAKFAVGAWHAGDVWLAVPFEVGMAGLFGGLGVYLLVGHDEGGIGARFGWRVFDLYNFVTGMMGNVLSYIRLFALGLCGGLLASTFNGIAFGFIAQPDGGLNWLSPLAICTVLLLVVGHALNFTLSIVGAFVHPVRLTFVEFFGTLQFSGGGKPYTPLARVKSDS